MANYTVVGTLGGHPSYPGIPRTMTWSYNGSSTGTGTTSSNPIIVAPGDTITFQRVATYSQFYLEVSDLNIFTNNADFTIIYSSGLGGDVVRTIASGSTTTDTIIGTHNIGGATDNLYIRRVVADTTPNAFTFTDVTGVSTSSTQTSNQITIGGMDSGASCAVSVSGGTYSKNGGGYTSSSTTAVNGDTFRVRHTSSSSFSTSVSTTLNCGGVTDTYTSTTAAQDTTPDAFSFTDVTGALASNLYTSNTVTITGITGSVSCSVSGGGSPTISVNGGSRTTSTTITNNQTLNVQLVASSSANTGVTATVTVGTVSSNYTVTTGAASVAGGSTPGGSGTFGIEVLDSDGSTSVLSPSTRYLTRLTNDVSISVAAGSNTLVSCNMTGLTTSNSELLMRRTGIASNFDLPQSTTIAITRESNGFRVTNNSDTTDQPATFNATVYVGRF